MRVCVDFYKVNQKKKKHVDRFLDKTKQKLPVFSPKLAVKLAVIEKSHHVCALETH